MDHSLIEGSGNLHSVSNNFATIKTSQMMKPMAGSSKDWKIQMSGLNRLRRQHQKKLKEMEEKNKVRRFIFIFHLGVLAYTVNI